MLRQSDPGSPQALEAVVAALAEESGDIHSTQPTERCVRDSDDRFAGARVVDFIPLLVHRFARERLRALATPPNTIPDQPPVSS